MSSRNLKKQSRSEISILVTLINGLNQNIGLPSYTSKNKVYWFFRVAAICFITTCILQVIALFKTKNDPERLFECFSILAFTGMGIFKLGSLRYNHNHWGYILKQISRLEFEQLHIPINSDMDYQSDDEETIQFTKYVNSYTKSFKVTFSRLRKMYYFTLLIFVLSPFSEPLFCIVRGLECPGYPHILPGWTPLDSFSIFGYLVTILCELISAIYCVFVHISFDLTAVGIMIFICGQLSLLRSYSVHIGGKGKLYTISKLRDERARFRIKNSHRLHLILVEYESLRFYYFIILVTMERKTRTSQSFLHFQFNNRIGQAT